MDHHIEQMHEYQEIKDCIDKYCQLTEQIRNPSRDGMIKALVEAQTIAYWRFVYSFSIVSSLPFLIVL